MRDFGLIALTLPAQVDPAVAIAASRAGGLGVLDLQLVRDWDGARGALARIAGTRGRYGVKCDGRAARRLGLTVADLPEQVRVAIVSPTDTATLEAWVRALHAREIEVLVEATCQSEAEQGAALGAAGLIARGRECGGRIGDETSLILLQRLLALDLLPVWAQGGIGLHTAAACYAAGAAGVVLDSQLALTRESPLSEDARVRIARMDGSETVCLGEGLGETYRLYQRFGLRAVEHVRALATDLRALADDQPGAALESWRAAIEGRAGWDDAERHIWLLGQDAAFAAGLARRFHTVGATLEGMREAIEVHVRTAKALLPLAEGAPLAQTHRTRFPIVQGPMTRVSDHAAFATCVAEAGALPFIALALMQAPEVEELLSATRRALGDRSWGVGILGFVPFELRQEQLRVVRAYRPPFALIAGGRPDQALELEQEGISTYLHVPSRGLLEQYLEAGARKFVFEGQECGGHVGPSTSFVLWNTMVDALLALLPAAELPACQVLFAGGVHDARSASMVAALAAPLAERGARVGVLLGTAYIFTEEAVASGAILPGFRDAAIRCDRTVLLETGPGHATRCADTPFASTFERERRRLAASGTTPDQVREALETLNLGRLRIAAKGIRRDPAGTDARTRYLDVAEAEQRQDGMYMLGQAAALRDSVCTVETLHRDVAVDGSRRLSRLSQPVLSMNASRNQERPCDVAIVGMGCLLPGAADLHSYWQNMLDRVDAITEIPPERWDAERYFDADRTARDKVYSRWGGFLDDVPFDPLRYGMPPNSLASIEPLQLLTLEVVRAALRDAGYEDRAFPRDRTSVILGVGGGISDLGQQYALRSGLPAVMSDVPNEVLARLPEWTEDSFPGILLNVAAGRVANRFDLGGVNYTVDAACASSLAAVYLATRELVSGSSDVVIVGGADTVQSPFGYLCFSKSQALSPRGRCRTFDASADGIVISEGVAALVLKRLADAERDGDRIYAVIKGVAGSSDGKDKGLTAPRPEGQVKALERAYAQAGFSPASVSLIEAHGTGTVAGDQAEVETLKRVFGAAGAERQGCAIGSVKSMIGHTKSTAGVAGLTKIALALHHRVLPPTLHVEQPNPRASFSESPFYVNSEARPWIEGRADHPRRAGVSAFGFGGTNFHAVLEEYREAIPGVPDEAAARRWPSELMIWRGESRQELAASLESLEQALAAGARPDLRDLAYSLWDRHRERATLTLAIVAFTPEDLREKLARAREGLSDHSQPDVHDPCGIFFSERPLAREGATAFLFPGQGSQYTGMARDLAIHFSEVRDQLELADLVLANCFPRPLSAYVFPPPSFDDETARVAQRALTQTDVAQPALGAVSIGLLRLLESLDVTPSLAAGHSYGEYAALCSAGVFDPDVLYRLSEARGRAIIQAATGDLGTMAAISEGRERVAAALGTLDDVWIANVNGPRQTVISGTQDGITRALERLAIEGIAGRPLPVACAFHSPLVAAARDRLATALAAVTFRQARIPVLSNATADAYPRMPGDISALLAEHLVSPVRFADQVEAMYRDGARIFVEVGPRSVLSGLVGQNLGIRRHLAVPLDGQGRSGITRLQHALGQLAAEGVPLSLDRLFRGRGARRLDLDAPGAEADPATLAPTTWLVNGGRARPAHQGTSSGVRSGVPAEANGAEVSAPPAAPVGRPNGAQSRVSGLPVPPRAMVSPSTPAPASPVGAAEAPHQRREADPGPTNHQEESAIPMDDATSQVMLQYQRLMQQFLEVQRQVMLTFLEGAPGQVAEASPLDRHGVLPDVQSGNGEWHDTLPQAGSIGPTTFATGNEASAALPPHVEPHALDRAAPVANGHQANGHYDDGRLASEIPDRDAITRRLRDIVGERTGYPPEMLDLGLDIEAELGIDSIKRVEIIGALRRTYVPADHPLAQEDMERLRGAKSLGRIVDVLHEIVGQGSEPRASAAANGAAHADAVEPAAEADVPRFVVTLTDA